MLKHFRDYIMRMNGEVKADRNNTKKFLFFLYLSMEVYEIHTSSPLEFF